MSKLDRPAAARLRARSLAFGAATVVLLVLALFSSSTSNLDDWASALTEGRSLSQHTVITYLEDIPRQVETAASAISTPDAATAAVMQQLAWPKASQQPPAAQQARAPVAQSEHQPTAHPAAAQPAAQPARKARIPRWLQPEQSALAFNAPAVAELAPVGPENVGPPRGTTLHFTFGSSVMVDFVKNWLHFLQKAGVGSFPTRCPCRRLLTDGPPAAAGPVPGGHGRRRAHQVLRQARASGTA